MAERKIGIQIELNGFRGVISNIKQLEEEIRKAKEDLMELEIGGDLFNELTGQISKAESKLMDLRKTTEGIGVEKKLEGYSKFAAGITSSFAAAQSAVALFGNESEAVTEAATKAQQILTLALSARGIEELALGAKIVARTISEKAATLATNASNKAMKALFTTIAANPIGALVAAIGLLVTAMIAFNSESEDTVKTQQELNSVISEEAVTLNIYADILKDVNSSMASRQFAIEQLKKSYPGFNAFLDEENRLTKEGILFVDLKTKALNAQAKAQYISQQMAKLEVEALQIQNKTLDEQLTFWDKVQGFYAGMTWGSHVKGIVDATNAQENQNEALKENSKQQKILRDAMKEVSDEQGDYASQLAVLEKKLKDKADQERKANQTTKDTSKLTKEQIALQSLYEKSLEAITKKYNLMIEELKTLAEVVTVDVEEPGIITQLKNFISVREDLVKDDFVKLFEDIGVAISSTGGNFKVVKDNLREATDNFGAFYDKAREGLASGALTKSTQEFQTVIKEQLDIAKKLLESLPPQISQSAFNAFTGLVTQYKQANELLKNEKFGFAFDTTEMKNFMNQTKQLLIAQGKIQFEYNEETKTFTKAVNEAGFNYLTAQEEQAKVLLSWTEKIKNKYIEIRLAELKLQEDRIKASNMTKEQQDALLKNIEKERDMVVENAKTYAETYTKGFKDIVTNVAEAEAKIRYFFQQVNELREKNKTLDASAFKELILNNTQLIAETLQKENAIILNARKGLYEQDLVKFQEDLAKKGIDITKYTEEEKLKILQAFLDQQIAATEKAEEKKRASQLITLEDMEKTLQVVNQSLGDIAGVAADTFGLQLDKLTYEYEKDMEMIVGDTKEANDKRVELEAIYQKEKRRIERQAQLTAMKFTLAQTTAQAAQAIVNIIATTPNPVAAGILAGISAAISAAQIGIIKQQIDFIQSQPMRRGGRLNAGGYISGPSHENGGVYAGGGYILEGSESVINRGSTLQYSNLLSNINQANGGRPILVNNPLDSRLVEAIAQQRTEPIRAYVVEGDISRSQAINRRLEQLASF